MSLTDRFAVRFTPHAEEELLRLYAFIVQRDNADLALAERALQAFGHAIEGLALSPVSYRKVSADNPFLRELIIPFGAAGYVALFEIEQARTVTILVVRYQLEDYYL